MKDKMKDKIYKAFPETEDEIWDECIRMHTDICEDQKKCGDLYKYTWLQINDYKCESIDHHCFFCEVVKRISNACEDCPGRKVALNFYCMNPSYDYARYDFKFVNELKRLNKIRKGTK